MGMTENPFFLYLSAAILRLFIFLPQRTFTSVLYLSSHGSLATQSPIASGSPASRRKSLAGVSGNLFRCYLRFRGRLKPPLGFWSAVETTTRVSFGERNRFRQ